jgi:hypothetical protein
MAAGECLARPTAEHFSMRFEWLHLDGSASLNYTLRVNLAAPSFAQCLDSVPEVVRAEESAADGAPMLAHLLGVVLVVVLVALGAASARRRHWGRCARAQEAFRRRHSFSAAPASHSVSVSSHESNSSSSSAFDASLHETPPNIPFM